MRFGLAGFVLCRGGGTGGRLRIGEGAGGRLERSGEGGKRCGSDLLLIFRFEEEEKLRANGCAQGSCSRHLSAQLGSPKRWGPVRAVPSGQS